MIPVAENDVSMIPKVVSAIRKMVAHPISRITIVGSAKGACAAAAAEAGCVFEDESELLPIRKTSIDYRALGHDRSGWLFQQLLKIEFARTCGTRYCLVCDVDTLFTSRQSFALGNKIVFHYSDELHLPYRKSNSALLGRDLSQTVSFVSHHTLFDREVVRSLIEEIEQLQGRPWYEAIVALARPDEPSVFSEYELYGSYFVAEAPHRAAVQYWHNVVFPRNQIRRALAIARMAPALIKTVSFHDYPEPNMD